MTLLRQQLGTVQERVSPGIKRRATLDDLAGLCGVPARLRCSITWVLPVEYSRKCGRELPAW